MTVIINNDSCCVAMIYSKAILFSAVFMSWEQWYLSILMEDEKHICFIRVRCQGLSAASLLLSTSRGYLMNFSVYL